MGEKFEKTFQATRKIGYFSMEIGVDKDVPTYSGGLGILAGDTLKAAADQGVPMVGVTLLYKKGYFKQILDPNGNQSETDDAWDVAGKLGEPLKERVTVHMSGRPVQIQAWQYEIIGVSGYTIPILFLDTDLEENDPQDRALTSHLYGGDQRYRLAQEVILGIGGLRMIKALGFDRINRYHMNEGHAALLSLELFRDSATKVKCDFNDREACTELVKNEIRGHCVFTTHTPVAAGHDQFTYDLVNDLIGHFLPIEIIQHFAGQDKLNMTLLALNMSHYVNSVARQHQHVSQHLFPGYRFSNITNGVHSASWTSPEMQEVFDKHIVNWRQDSFELRNVLRIPSRDILHAHRASKDKLIKHLNETYGFDLEPHVFTVGFARRSATYKRADLIFQDIARLRRIAKEFPVQIIFGGKAHPADGEGKDLIRKIHWHMGELRENMKIVYIPNYNIDLAQMIIPGVDIWLNTPMRPKEASGTSGMKAAHNGVPQISIQDGWWIEGHIEGVTGWEIGPVPTEDTEDFNDSTSDAEELYDKLEYVILPLFYKEQHKWLMVMRNAIAFNASFFNTHRMIQQYVLHAYLL